MPAPSILSMQTSLLSGAAASFDAGVPAGLGTGDLDLICVVALSSVPGKALAIPSGYNGIINGGPAGARIRIMACWRHAGTTPADATVELTDATDIQRAAAVRYRIAGHDETTPIDVASASLVDDTDNMKDDPTGFAVPGITTQTDQALVFAAAALASSYIQKISGDDRFAVSSPWSLAGLARVITFAGATNNGAGAIATRAVATAGSSGTCSFEVDAFTTKDEQFPWTGGMFAIRAADPVPAGGPASRARPRVLMF